MIQTGKIQVPRIAKFIVMICETMTMCIKVSSITRKLMAASKWNSIFKG